MEVSSGCLVIKKKSSSGCLIIKKKVVNNPWKASSGLVLTSEEKSYRLAEGDENDHGKFSHRAWCKDSGGLNRKVGLQEDEADKLVTLPQSTYEENVGETIRVQGKSGVLKIMLNKKRRMDLPPHPIYEHKEKGEMKRSRLEDFLKVDLALCAGSSYPVLPRMAKHKDVKFEEENKEGYEKSNIDIRKNIRYKESGMSGRNSSSKAVEMEKDGTCTALALGLPRLRAIQTLENFQGLEETKDLRETKSKRVGATEKQILRGKIRKMLVDAGWKIDYRPRRNREYLDAVYINPNGTAYWSIIKAYDALKKQLQEDKASGKSGVGSSSLPSLPEDLLNKLTRQTKKKVREELKRKSLEDDLVISGKGHGLGNDTGRDQECEKLAPSETWIYNSDRTGLKDRSGYK